MTEASASSDLSWLDSFATPDAPLVYNLSNDQTLGIDICTRIRLAEEVIHRAVRAELISREIPVFILGAGAAGMAAAVTALELQVPVILRNSGETPFSPQANCSCRWLHPNQYQWPLPDCVCPTFPAQPGAKVSLPWQEALACDVARQWQPTFENIKAHPLLTKQFGEPLEIQAGSLAERGLELVRKADPKQECGLFFLCTGFREETTIQSFTGANYWSDDLLAEKNYGLAADENAHILISGGGDGAQQDLLRIAWQQHPLAVLMPIREAARSSADGRAWWLVVERELLDRGAVRRDFPERLFARLLESMSPAVWQTVAAVIRGSLRPEFARSRVTFIYRGAEPPASYPLNRFLIELLNQYCRAELNRPLLRPSLQVSAILPHGEHHCANSAPQCFGKDHEVILKNRRGANQPPAYYNIIVLRHGVDASTL